MSNSADNTAAVLMDALQQIHYYKDQTVVVGLTGGSFEDAASRKTMLEDVFFLASVGARPVVLHGGSVPIQGILDEPRQNVECEIAVELNHKLADEYEAIGGRAMTLNFESDAVLSGSQPEGSLVGILDSVDRIVIDNLCYAGQTPFIPAFCENQSGEHFILEPMVATTQIAFQLAAKAAVIVAGGFKGADSVQDSDLLLAECESFQGHVHIVPSSTSHGILLQLFSSNQPGTIIGRAV